jgi:hypothetical protein
MNNQEIIDNAPKNATNIDTDSIYWLISSKDKPQAYLYGIWTYCEPRAKLRSLADIKRIVELENEKLTLCKSELETYALVMANARRLIKANVRTSNGRLFSEIFGTGFGTGRDSARSLGLNPDCNKTDYNQMRRHIDLEALKEPRT